MKLKDIQIGEIYIVRVSGRLCRVRVDARRENYYGRPRLDATNLDTGRKLVLRGAARLRYPAKKNEETFAELEENYKKNTRVENAKQD